MKKLFFSVILMMLFFIYGCSVKDLVKPEQVVDEQGLAIGDVNARKIHGPVFTVYPTASDDTENLKQAFADAKSAGPGSVVQLVSGQYTIGPVEVRDFSGYFRGAGKGKTIISNLPGLPCEIQYTIENSMPYLLQFVGGDIIISDLTLKINDGKPCSESPTNESWIGDMMATVLVLADYSATYVPANRNIDAEVKNVDFIAGDLMGGTNLYGLTGNVNMSLYCGTPIWNPTGLDFSLDKGNITISECGFINNGVGPDFAGFAENSVLVVENNLIEGYGYGMFIWCNFEANLIIKNNQLKGGVWFDIYIDNNDYGYYPDIELNNRADYKIIGNDIQGLPGIPSLVMSDYRRTMVPEEGFPQLFDITFNNFHTQDGGTAILGLNNMDAKIWNNKFHGTGAAGVMLDGDAGTNTFAENIKVMGNNFWNANYADANVYLGPNTMNCKVIGVSTDKVVDEGINNTVIGVKSQKHGFNHRWDRTSNVPNMREKMMLMHKP